MSQQITADAVRDEVWEMRYAVKVQVLAAQAEVRARFSPALSEIEFILQLLDTGTDVGAAEAARRFRSLRAGIREAL